MDQDPHWTILSDADRTEIERLIEQNLVVSAIKWYREATGKGLAESITTIEAFVGLRKKGKFSITP